MLVANKATSIMHPYKQYMFHTDNVFREPDFEKNPQLSFYNYCYSQWIDPFPFYVSAY